MSLDLDDTIAAIASAAGGAARGIVRISGPGAIGCVTAVFRPDDGPPSLPGSSLVTHFPEGPPSRKRHRGRILAEVDSQAGAWEPVGGQATVTQGQLSLPKLGAVPARAYLWPTSRSYTRQPSAELHLISSPPILQAALAAVCAAGARLARPGEFTLRAFLAGRLDLTQAEAVLGVIDAASGQELAAALSQLAGGLAGPLGQLREALLDLLAHLEAGLDFVEEDIEFITPAELTAQLNAAEAQVAAIAQQLTGRGEAGELPTVVLVGLPNAGKSSLFNALAGADSAIVSPLAGTTRDFVSRCIRLPQGECLLVDTAGLDTAQPADEIADAAQAVARRRTSAADLTLLCVDASSPAKPDIPDLPAAPRRLLVWTKSDRARAATGESAPGSIATSSLTGQGLAALRAAIGEQLNARSGEAGVVASTADRCRQSLRLAEAALTRASAAAGDQAGQELVAAEVRLALEELGQVVGAVYTEDLLDRVFSRFCIGK